MERNSDLEGLLAKLRWMQSKSTSGSSSTPTMAAREGHKIRSGDVDPSDLLET
ncbi:hypothetical protein TIFTF001_015635 [Ficus carica]|uniref:Uncharacterized protein n=1 Tax=Ficus carica TaxID=3494 RepID=A0AA88D5A5_FICCA|nr:hypothetical protein TIFTF001_015635 [Ficus carica]